LTDLPKITLLPMLADGEFRSGQDLADALGISRTAIWKQLNKLEELGLAIESVKGRGYRIAGGLDLLDEQRIRADLDQDAATLLNRLVISPSTSSTNAQAMQAIEQGSAGGWVFTAEQQTAGRGRRGRQWVSPFASNLYVSLVWEFTQGAAALEGLSLAIGVAVADALANCGLPPVQLKWPNDVLSDGAKLGGILLEMTGDVTGACQVVVGIGINVQMPANAATDIDQAWTDLQTLGGGEYSGRNQVLAQLLNELLPMMARFEREGFAQWRDRWMQLDAFAGQPVVLTSGPKSMAGVARGVDGRGALQLETSVGIESIFGGEMSLRPQS
jgi:BirA family transcriptional regulator, biotin operon repressor / biotin---[acetyl-CoA-carboxylase] ligase